MSDERIFPSEDAFELLGVVQGYLQGAPNDLLAERRLRALGRLLGEIRASLDHADDERPSGDWPRLVK